MDRIIINESDLNRLIYENISNLLNEGGIDEIRHSTFNKINPFSREFFLRNKGKDRSWGSDSSSMFNNGPKQMRNLSGNKLDQDSDEYKAYNKYTDRASRKNIGTFGSFSGGESIADKINDLKFIQAKVRGYLAKGTYFADDEKTQTIVKNFIRACYTARGVMTSMYNRNKNNSSYEINRQRYAQNRVNNIPKKLRQKIAIICDPERLDMLTPRQKKNLQVFLLRDILPNENYRDLIPPEKRDNIINFVGADAYKDAVGGVSMVSESTDENIFTGWLTKSTNHSNGGTINTTVGNHGLKGLLKPTHKGSGKWVKELRREVVEMYRNGYFNTGKATNTLMVWVKQFIDLLDVDYRIWPIGALLGVGGLVMGCTDPKQPVPEPEPVTIQKNIGEELGKADITTEGLQQIWEACHGKEVLCVTVTGYEDTHDGPNWNDQKGTKLAQDRVKDAIQQISSIGIKDIQNGGIKINDSHFRGVTVTIVVAGTNAQQAVNESKTYLTNFYKDGNGNLVYVFTFPNTYGSMNNNTYRNMDYTNDNGQRQSLEESLDRAIRLAMKKYID